LGFWNINPEIHELRGLARELDAIRDKMIDVIRRITVNWFYYQRPSNGDSYYPSGEHYEYLASTISSHENPSEIRPEHSVIFQAYDIGLMGCELPADDMTGTALWEGQELSTWDPVGRLQNMACADELEPRFIHPTSVIDSSGVNLYHCFPPLYNRLGLSQVESVSPYYAALDGNRNCPDRARWFGTWDTQYPFVRPSMYHNSGTIYDVYQQRNAVGDLIGIPPTVPELSVATESPEWFPTSPSVMALEVRIIDAYLLSDYL
jgi:hypothetical protein